MTYLDEMKEDVKQAIKWNYEKTDWTSNRDGMEQELNDELWIDDSVTGNASGSYYCNSQKAREQVTSNGIDYFIEACNEFCISTEEVGERFLNEDWEYVDVTIRCYLLGQVISEVLDELEEDGYFEEEETN